MLISGLVATMPVFNNGIEKLLEYVVTLLVARHCTHCQDVRVAWRRGAATVTSPSGRSKPRPLRLRAERGPGDPNPPKVQGRAMAPCPGGFLGRRKPDATGMCIPGLSTPV